MEAMLDETLQSEAFKRLREGKWLRIAYLQSSVRLRIHKKEYCESPLTLIPDHGIAFQLVNTRPAVQGRHCGTAESLLEQQSGLSMRLYCRSSPCWREALPGNLFSVDEGGEHSQIPKRAPFARTFEMFRWTGG